MSVKIAVFASGSGSNAENIYSYFRKKNTAEIVLMLSNKADSYALCRANRLKIPSIVISRDDLNNSEKILSILHGYKVDFIVLAGFLLKIPSFLVSEFPDRIINIHPALLPKYGGKGMYGQHVHEAVVAAHETESGITIHYVNEHYDAGNIIFQAVCPIAPTDTPDDVAAKVHELEYEHFPQVIEQVILDLRK